MKTNEEILRAEIGKLLKEGYTLEEIEDTVKYIEKRSYLMPLVIERGWDYVCQYETLPPRFIREFKDEVNWDLISNFQKLDSDFIEEFSDIVNWYYIFMCQDNLNAETLYKYRDKIRDSIMDILKDRLITGLDKLELSTDDLYYSDNKIIDLELCMISNEEPVDITKRNSISRDRKKFTSYYITFKNGLKIVSVLYEDGNRKDIYYLNYQLRQINDYKNGVLYHTYTKDGSEVWIEKINGKTVKYFLNGDEKSQYDENGNVIILCKENGEGYFKYDQYGNLIYSKNKHGFEDWYDYDDLGRRIYWKNSDGHEQWYKYIKGKKCIYKDYSNFVTSFADYDENGNLIHIKDSRGNETWYDDDSRKIHEINEGIEFWIEYDSLGRRHILYSNPNERK